MSMANDVKMDWIDRTLSFINPRAAYERIAWKQGIRGYDSGSRAGNNSGWVAINAPAEQMNQGQRDIIRARSRDLENNADIAEAIIGTFERNVIRTGMHVQAKPIGKDGNEDEKLGKTMEKLWERWCRPENCDITGESTFGEMQGMATRRMIADGGILFVLSDNPYKNAEIPLILQMREVDEIDSTRFSYGAAGENRIINGIEVNEYNKPVAFWLKTITPDGLILGDSKRIDAERVIYLRKKIRPSQLREVPKLANTINRVRDVNEYSEAVSIKERVLACLSVFIKKAIPGGGVGRGSNIASPKDEKTGYAVKTLSPGLVTELMPGDDVTSVNPSGQASNAKEFIASQQRLIAAGQGLSYEAVARDMSEVNYSSARQGLIEDKKTYEMLQEYIKRHLCEKVWREFITQAVLADKLNIPDFFTNKEDYLNHDWIAPGSDWIDPLKEVKANAEALESNQVTLEDICAKSGRDWREVMAQRKKEIDFEKSLEDNNAGKK